MAGDCVKPGCSRPQRRFRLRCRPEVDEDAYCVVTLRVSMLSSRAFTSGHSESRMLK